MTRPSRTTRSRWNALAVIPAAAIVMSACTDVPTGLTATAPAAAAASAGGARSSVSSYEITDLGTLGGFFSVALGVNDAGQAGGSANTAEEIARAFVWSGGQMTDLGSLAPDGNILAIGPNNRGELTGLAELAQLDADNEDLCGFGTHRVCVAAYRRGSAWAQLPLLDGPNSVAVNLNDRGQSVGLAETAVRDQSCAAGTPFQVHQYAPVVWSATSDKPQVLAVLPGDEVGFAYGINDHDQVVGSTGSCATTSVIGSGVLTGRHAVLWDRGTAIPLDAPGSTNAISTAYSINNQGTVAGVSGTSTLHAALWSRGAGSQNLGALEGDVGSIANWINNRGQVVGASCPDVGMCKPGPEVPSRAFLWQDGMMTDLNALAVGGTSMFLVNALAMNDRGQIVGLGVTADGLPHAFLATPVSGQARGQVAAVGRTTRTTTKVR